MNIHYRASRKLAGNGHSGTLESGIPVDRDTPQVGALSIGSNLGYLPPSISGGPKATHFAEDGGSPKRL
jgi:hypothetical protein